MRIFLVLYKALHVYKVRYLATQASTSFKRATQEPLNVLIDSLTCKLMLFCPMSFRAYSHCCCHTNDLEMGRHSASASQLCLLSSDFLRLRIFQYFGGT